MIDFSKIELSTMQSNPYNWVRIDNLFSPQNATALANTFPRDNFKAVSGYGGEKDYQYEARALIPMGESGISHADELSTEWLNLACDFLSKEYRIAMSSLTKLDLSSAPLEVNIFHYGPGACLGPHPDLPDKIVTHILYFNQSWEKSRGGHLHILNSSDPESIFVDVEPIVGSSAVLVRSDRSWHAVSQVSSGCTSSRRSLTATFYHPESISSMWPPGDETSLHLIASDDY
jgi:hypothetical protein